MSTTDRIVGLVAEALTDEQNILFNDSGALGIVLDTRILNVARKHPLDLRSCNVRALMPREGDPYLWLVVDPVIITRALMLAGAAYVETTKCGAARPAGEPVHSEEGQADLLHVPEAGHWPNEVSGDEPPGGPPGRSTAEQPADVVPDSGAAGEPRPGSEEPAPRLD